MVSRYKIVRAHSRGCIGDITLTLRRVISSNTSPQVYLLLIDMHKAWAIETCFLSLESTVTYAICRYVWTGHKAQGLNLNISCLLPTYTVKCTISDNSTYVMVWMIVGITVPLQANLVHTYSPTTNSSAASAYCNVPCQQPNVRQYIQCKLQNTLLTWISLSMYIIYTYVLHCIH